MIIVAVGLILRENLPEGTQVLLCQRKKSSRYGLKWEFPGGKVESGELPADGLRRELREELDISATIADLYHRQQHFYPDSGAFDVHYYTVPSYSGIIVNRVFKTTEWVPLIRLRDFDILEGNSEVVGKLVSDHAKSPDR